MVFYSPQSYQPGLRLVDGALQNLQEGNPRFSADNAVVAAGTTALTAKPLLATINVLVQGPVGGVVLPQASPGMVIYLFGQSSNAATVYGYPGDFVDGSASKQLTAGSRCAYYCVAPRTWFSVVMGAASV